MDQPAGTGGGRGAISVRHEGVARSHARRSWWWSAESSRPTPSRTKVAHPMRPTRKA